MMFSPIKRLFAKSAMQDKGIALQPPGEVFPWPKSTTLTALEDLIIGVPVAILGQDETIGSVIRSDPDAEIRVPTKPNESLILIRLKAGMSASLNKSCQAMVIANDKRPKRIMVKTGSGKTGQTLTPNGDSR